jgi:AcrR family transcriptional regulator
MGRTPSDIAARIVEAARERFLHDGVDGAALRAIAADAGTSIGMVYYHFKTKDELFLAVIEESYVKLLEDITRACDPALPPRERIRAIYRRIGAVDERESQVVRLVIREALVSSQRLSKVLARFSRGHIPLVLQAIADGVRDRSIRADVPPLLLLPIIAAVGVIPQFALRQLSPDASPNIADVLVDVLYGGSRSTAD